MTYRFEVQHLPAGRARFTHGAHSADSEHALARKLVEADMPGGPVVGGRPGHTDWTARSLHALAATTLSEGDRGFARGIYATDARFSSEPLHPALERAIARARERRREAAERAAGRVVAGQGEKPLAGPCERDPATPRKMGR